jgi:glycosyltransferase involved in cell wall biosynthesis
VVGHVGRLAPEKNLGFLAQAVSRFLAERDDAHFLVVGAGPSSKSIREQFERAGVADRLHMPGMLERQDLVDAYHAMDIFAFASKTETQGMVLAEAMSAGVPVVAIDAAGAREVVRDRVNGRLLDGEDASQLVEALHDLAAMAPQARGALVDEARKTAREYDLPVIARRILSVYSSLAGRTRSRGNPDDTAWAQAMRYLKAEWDILANVAGSARDALTTDAMPEDR